MRATFLKYEQIERPVVRELELLEKELGIILRSEVDLIFGIGEHLIAIKGKRVRPALVFLCSHIGKPDPDRAVKVGVAIELIHTATLLHDDSIDRSGLRRGLPTVNRLWNDQVSVIMGDYLFCKAFGLMHESGLEDIARVLVLGSQRTTFGEMAQMDRRGDCDLPEETYVEVVRHKTAALFSSACEAGAIVGGVGGEDRRRLIDYGERIGIAFQIVDDILDFTGDVGRMGKPLGNDLRDGRVTLPLIAALRNAPPKEAGAVRSIVGAGDIDESGWDAVVEFIETYGGLEYSRDLSRRFVDEALAAISGVIDSPAKQSLIRLAGLVVSRRK